MSAAKSAARWIAALLLAQAVLGPIVNFSILGKVFANPPGFLVNAAAHSQELAIGVLLLLVMGAISVGIAIAAWPVVRPRSERMALWLAVLGAAGFALKAAEATAVMSMLSLSQSYVAAAGASPELYEGLRVTVGAARNWAHYIQLICGSGLLIVLFWALYRFSLVPRWLAGFCMATALLQLYAVSTPLFGRPVNFSLLMPLGIAFLALVAWLLWRGLADPDAPQSAGR